MLGRPAYLVGCCDVMMVLPLEPKNRGPLGPSLFFHTPPFGVMGERTRENGKGNKGQGEGVCVPEG